jgi:hypothetical protein
LGKNGVPKRKSVATASARRRVRLTSTMSRALPRLTHESAQAQPTAPTIPILAMVARSVRADRDTSPANQRRTRLVPSGLSNRRQSA